MIKTPPSSRLLFAYGSLRPACTGGPHEAQRMRAWLSRTALWTGPARIRGALYRVDWYPALVPDPARDTWVHGDLFTLADDGPSWERLDRYEEVGPDFASPPEYRRELHPVSGGAGDVLAWVYVYARATDGLTRIASGNFLE